MPELERIRPDSGTDPENGRPKPTPDTGSRRMHCAFDALSTRCSEQLAAASVAV